MLAQSPSPPLELCYLYFLILYFTKFVAEIVCCRRPPAPKPLSTTSSPSTSTSSLTTSTSSTSSTASTSSTSSDSSDVVDYEDLVKGYIDEGKCDSVTTGSSCGDNATSYYAEFEYNGRRVVIANGIPNHDAEHDQFKVNPSTRCER